MSFIVAEVHDELFQGWIKETENNFMLMIETMMKVAEEIKTKVQTEYSPVLTGKLSRSFRETIITDNSRMKVVEVKMSALNPRTGYDYAETQHRGYRYSKSGRMVRYNHESMNLGFFNYKQDLDGNFKQTKSYENPISVGHKGRSEYLMWAIIDSQQSAFEIIETDYLSMFMGGFIV